ncbi:MAG TPA: YdeI/OmpD-associated family protein [Candidatus Kapabacteria bacterium]|nr:YdeI/OmpD-associated family protein [Candidatus Kapabacteria bacterium]
MRKKFKGTVVKLSDPGSANLGWRVVDIPFDVKNAFGKGGRLPVRGEVNGFPFRTSLFPRKDGKHFLLLNKQMQNGAGVTMLGDKINVAIELDEEERTVAIPPLLKKILSEEDGLLEYFEAFTYSMRKFMVDSIVNTKTPAAKRRRAERIAMILMEMRDGEITPPPILEAEFAHNPKARKGWARMSPSQRRGHLWGIFYYQNPESRARRARQAFEEMKKYTE